MKKCLIPVSSMMILRNFFENESLNFLLSICALPLIPESGFLTSCAKVLARFAAIFWVENVLEESIILLRLSTHEISSIKTSYWILHLTVRSITLLLFDSKFSSKSLFVFDPSFPIAFFKKTESFNFDSLENWSVTLFTSFLLKNQPIKVKEK